MHFFLEIEKISEAVIRQNKLMKIAIYFRVSTEDQAKRDILLKSKESVLRLLLKRETLRYSKSIKTMV